MKRLTAPSRRAAPASPDQLAMSEATAYLRDADPAALAAVQWHSRCEQGLSAAESAQFQQWLTADTAHRAAFAGLDRSLRQLRSLPAERTAHLRRPRATQTPATASTARHAPPAPVRAPAPKPGAPRRGWLAALMPRPAMVALCCATLVAVGAGWWHWLQQPLFEQVYATQRAQLLDVALPDGSRLALDAATRVEVTLYRDRRELRLPHGQAMFNVAPDPSRPFSVLAGPARVTVLGTRFAVRCRNCSAKAGAGAATAEVEVEHGHVTVAGVSASAAAPAAHLRAGQAISVSTARLGQVNPIGLSSVAPWRRGMLRFSSTPLAEALREFERYAPPGLQVRDPEVARMAIGGSYRADDPAAFAQALPRILPVRLLRRDDGVTEVVRGK